MFAVQADPLGLLVAFGAGMLSFLSPCVLPLVPGYLSMVSGLTASELAARPAAPPPLADPVAAPVLVGGDAGAAVLAGGPATAGIPASRALAPAAGAASPAPTGLPPADARRRLLVGIAGFVGGFTLVFTLLGAAATAIGHLLLTHQRLLDTVSGALIVAFGLFLAAQGAGIRLPVAMVGERRLAVRSGRLGRWAPPVLGMAFAFGWTPCIGPVLGSVLGLAASRATLAGGVALLVAYSLGLGVPFLLTGLAFGRVTGTLARVRSGLRWVQLGGAAVLVAFGVLLVTGDLGMVSSWFSHLLNALHLGRLSTS